MENGRKTWIFADGHLPPRGDVDPVGHESLLITNVQNVDAQITLDLLFLDKDPIEGIPLKVQAKRAAVFRLDLPLGETGFCIPQDTQYAMVVHSTVPVVCLFGRMDRRANMAYYAVGSYSE